MKFFRNVAHFADTASNDQLRSKLVELEIVRDHLTSDRTRKDCTVAIQILKRELLDRMEADNTIKKVT